MFFKEAAFHKVFDLSNFHVHFLSFFTTIDILFLSHFMLCILFDFAV